MAKTKERIEEIKQRILNIAQQTLGLPLLFRPAKPVQVPTPAVLGQPVKCDAYRVEIVSPTGVGIDVGQIAFDSESGNVFLCSGVLNNTPTLSMLFDKMDPKDRF